MITVVIAENEERIKEMLLKMLSKAGNTNIHIVKQADIMKIIEEESLKRRSLWKTKLSN